MSASEATQPDPGRGGAPGQDHHQAAGQDHNRAARRGLAAYLLFPRPEGWAKAQIAPACYLLAASSTGDFGGWRRFLLLWLALEYLIYAARYQWNDIRGIEADRIHAETRARSRLPAGETETGKRRNITLSYTVAALRIIVALVIGAVAGLLRQVFFLAGLVFVIAVSYELLRALPAGRSRAARNAQPVAVWLVVGLGYLARGGLGLRLAGLAWGSLAMLAGLVCVTSFGIMFVLLTWVLEATSYCAADAGGDWHIRPGLAAKPHLAALLLYLGRPLWTDPVAPGDARYCGADRILREGGKLTAPWNLALLAAAVSGAVEGASLARPLPGGAASCAAYLAIIGAAGAFLLACGTTGTGRWTITAACALTMSGAAVAGATAMPAIACLPWLAVASLYSAFSGSSYRGLVAAGPRLAAALRRPFPPGSPSPARQRLR